MSVVVRAKPPDSTRIILSDNSILKLSEPNRVSLASSITGGKAAAVDYKILEKGCKKRSKALKLAKKAKKKHNYGTRKVKKINLIGGLNNNVGLSISKVQK